MNQLNEIVEASIPEREAFAFLWSFKDSIIAIESLQEKLEVYEAITDFAFFGKDPEFSSPVGRVLWRAIKANLVRSVRRYDSSVKNGKKGGAPTGNQNAKKQPKTTQNNPNDKDKDKDKDNVCVDTPRANAPHTHIQEEISKLKNRRDELREKAEEEYLKHGSYSEEWKRAYNNLKRADAEFEAAMTFDRFNDFLVKQCPELASCMKPLTEKEYVYWLYTSDRDWLADTCKKMNGRKDTKTKFDNLNAALLSWWNQDYNNSKK